MTGPGCTAPSPCPRRRHYRRAPSTAGPGSCGCPRRAGRKPAPLQWQHGPTSVSAGIPRAGAIEQCRQHVDKLYREIHDTAGRQLASRPMRNGAATPPSCTVRQDGHSEMLTRLKRRMPRRDAAMSSARETTSDKPQAVSLRGKRPDRQSHQLTTRVTRIRPMLMDRKNVVTARQIKVDTGFSGAMGPAAGCPSGRLARAVLSPANPPPIAPGAGTRLEEVDGRGYAPTGGGRCAR